MIRSFTIILILNLLPLKNMVGQFITESRYDPYVISDFIILDEVSYRLNITSTCKDGFLSVVKNGMEENYGTGYYVKNSKFDVEEDRWMALTYDQYGDEIYRPHLVLQYQNDQNEIITVEQNPNQYNSSIYFKDFAIYKDSLIIIMRADSAIFEVIDYYINTVSTIDIGKAYNFIDYKFENIYGFTDNSIELIDSAFQIFSSKEILEIIEGYKWRDDTLFVKTPSALYKLSHTLEIVEMIPFEPSQIITDFKFSGDTIYLIDNTSDISTLIRWYVSEDNNGLSVSESFEHLTYDKFVGGDQNELVSGKQTTKSFDADIEYAIYSRIDQIDEEQYDYALELDNVLYIKDTFMIHIFQGDTVIEYNHEFEFDYTILNNSLDTLNSFLVTSNRLKGHGCFWWQFSENLENQNIPPGKQRSYSNTFKFIAQFDYFCLYLVSGNKAFDTQIDNNSSCRVGITAVENILDYPVKIFPNPTEGIIYIESQYLFEEFTLVNLQGQKVKLPNNNFKNEIDLSGLPSGIYLLILKSKEGFNILKKIVVY